jgi:uncharacterized membrane protein
MLLKNIVPPLPIDDCSRYVSGIEEVNGQRAVVESVYWAVEYLLHNVVYHVVKEIVPRKAKKEILSR